MMSSQLHIWYWDVRFFRPQQEEEFFVRVSPAGMLWVIPTRLKRRVRELLWSGLRRRRRRKLS